MRAVAYINHDKKRVRELYNPFLKAWFPKGISDPSLTFLVVQPLEIEFWANTQESFLTSTKVEFPILAGEKFPPEHGEMTI
jgi:general stress protein 26